MTNSAELFFNLTICDDQPFPAGQDLEYYFKQANETEEIATIDSYFAFIPGSCAIDNIEY
jgi:hypothetical protein